MNALPADPARMSARAARDAIRASELSGAELVAACRARAEARADLRAWSVLDPQAQLDGTADGPLAGLPVGVKDIIATAGMTTQFGSPIHASHVPAADAACVAALRMAGGLVMGKTKTTEFAAYTPTDTRNPHNPAHTPGGSSSGSAAAVADFHVPLAIGTQTAGSVIRPAAYCGVVGYKPSFGLIDTAGTLAFSASLDTLGVFARDVADAALFAGAMAGWDALGTLAPAAPRRVRIVRAPQWERAEPEMIAAVEAAAACFADAGIPVEEAPLPEDFEVLAELQDRVQVFEGRRALAWERMAHPDLLSPGLRGHFDRIAALPFDEYWAARAAQRDWQHRVARMIPPGEVWLTASAPGAAPEGLEATGDPIFCRAWTFLHMPCVGLPAGTGAAGLPLGVQLVAPQGDDARALAAAAWLEERIGQGGR